MERQKHLKREQETKRDEVQRPISLFNSPVYLPHQVTSNYELNMAMTKIQRALGKKVRKERGEVIGMFGGFQSLLIWMRRN